MSSFFVEEHDNVRLFSNYYYETKLWHAQKLWLVLFHTKLPPEFIITEKCSLIAQGSFILKYEACVYAGG